MTDRIINFKFTVVNKNNFTDEELKNWYEERYNSIKNAKFKILKIGRKIIEAELRTNVSTTDQEDSGIRLRKKMEALDLFDMFIDVDDDGNYPINNNLVEPNLLKYKFIKF